MRATSHDPEGPTLRRVARAVAGVVPLVLMLVFCRLGECVPNLAVLDYRPRRPCAPDDVVGLCYDSDNPPLFRIAHVGLFALTGMLALAWPAIVGRWRARREVALQARIGRPWVDAARDDIELTVRAVGFVLWPFWFACECFAVPFSSPHGLVHLLFGAVALSLVLDLLRPYGRSRRAPPGGEDPS